MPTMLARYEFKYLIDEDQADWIREVVKCFCEPDEYGASGNYAVNSLYCDTRDWMLAKQTIAGTRHRFKLRIRTYGWKEDDTVFVENKGRVGTSIVKERALMDRKYVEPLLKGELPPGGIPAKKASHQADLDGFRNLYDAIDARPRLWVRYQREAWMSSYGDGARLTFDRAVEIQAPDPEHPYVPDHTQWTLVPIGDGSPVSRARPLMVLEMKFNGASPRWMEKVVQRLGLLRISYSKYCLGAEHLGDVPWNRWERESAWTG